MGRGSGKELGKNRGDKEKKLLGDES